MAVHHISKLVTFNAARPAPHRLHDTDRARVVVVGLDPGQAIPPHPEDNQPFFFIVSGSGVITTPEGDLEVSAGDWVEGVRGGMRGMRAGRERMVVLATAVI